MKNFVRVALTGALIFAAGGCGGPPMVVDGYSLGSALWTRDAAALRARASFDLACPREQVNLKVISARAFGFREVGVAETVGAEGCSGRATYMRLHIGDEWILNGSTRREAAANSARAD